MARIGASGVIAVAAAAGLSVVLAASAAESEDGPGMTLVESFVDGITTLSGSFEQAVIDAGGQVLETSSGTLEIKRPGQFRWIYVEPYEQWLVADGLNVWSYDVDLEQVTVKPQAQALSKTPAMLLGGSDAALADFRYAGSYDEAGTTWVRLRPVDTDSGFLRVELGFVDGVINRMAFFDNLEQTTLVALADLTINTPLADGVFDFTIPDDVDVVGTPAPTAAENRDRPSL